MPETVPAAPAPVRRGDRGPAVTEIRLALHRLALLPVAQVADESYGAVEEAAVRTFQQQRGLAAHGEVDGDTYRLLLESRYRLGDRITLFRPGRLMRGDDIRALQERLLELGYNTGRVDGIFGQDTADALRAFQTDSGLVPDGTCGPATLRALTLLGRKVTGGSPLRLRQKDYLRDAGPALMGKRIALDAAGLPDRAGGAAELAWDVVRRIEGRLSVMGARPSLTRGPDHFPDLSQRAALANDVRADLLVSLAVTDSAEGDDGSGTTGVAAYYYGGSATSSDVGEELAGLLQREITARTSLTDRGTSPRPYELLRQTRMPAVQLELASAPGRSALGDPVLRDAVAEAVVAAVQRFYFTEDADIATGTWTFPTDLRA